MSLGFGRRDRSISVIVCYLKFDDGRRTPVIALRPRVIMLSSPRSKGPDLAIARLRILLLGVVSIGVAATPTLGDEPAGRAKLVAASFMPQMSASVPADGCDDPLVPLDCRPDGVMASFSPPYLAVARSPLGSSRLDISQAKRCGVNAFNMLLGPFMLNGDVGAKATCYSDVILGLYQAAWETDDFTIAPEIWDDMKAAGPAAGRLARSFGVLRRWSFSPEKDTWTKVDGRYLVILRITGNLKGVVSYAEAARVMFGPLGGRDRVHLVLYVPNPSDRSSVPEDWVEGADAFTYWPNMDHALTARLITAAEAFAKDRRKPLIRGVMPAFAQSRPGLAPTPPNVREKLGMTDFLSDWLGVLRSGSSAVFIDTFNDLSEDSAINEESNHGRAFLELNAAFARAFRSGGAPAAAGERVFLFHHPQRCRDTILPPGVARMGTLPWAWTQPTDYVGAVAMLTSPATVEVAIGGEVVGRRDLPAGASAWLLYVPVPAGPKAHAGAKVYPQTGDPALTGRGLAFTADRLSQTAFGRSGNAEVSVRVIRRGESRRFVSHRPIAGEACRGELTTIGDVFDLDAR